MSTPPPPPSSFGPPGGTPPPPPWANQSLQPGPGPASRGGSNTPKIIAAFVAVAVLAGGGVFLATRNSDGKKAVTVTTTPDTTNSSDTTEPDTAAATTVAPTTTALAPTTTIAATTTVATAAPTTTTPFTLPAGAVDLGNEVYIIPPAGWTNTPDARSGANILTNGTEKVVLELAQRPLGESPAALGQVYLDTFDPSLEPVAVTESQSLPITSGAIPSVKYRVYYRTWDPNGTNGSGLLGGLYLYQRGDGLSMIYDVYSSAGGSMGVGSDAIQSLDSSFAAAPALGPVSALTSAPTFRLTTKTPPILVDANIGFTPAPGFTATPGDGSNFGQAAWDDYFYDVSKFSGQANLDAALQQTKASLDTDYSNVTFGPVQPQPGLDDTVTRVGVSWTGTYTKNGGATTGVIDVYFDTTTGNAIGIDRNWYTLADGSEPHATEANFMFANLGDSIQITGIQ